MSTQLRILITEDREALNALAENQSEKIIINRLSEHFFVENDKRILLGAFKDNEMVGFIALAFFDNFPWSSILYMKIKSTLSMTNRLKFLLQLVDDCFSWSESRGANRIFIVYKPQRRGHFLNSRLYPLVKKLSRLGGYTFITEAVIPAGHKAQYTYEMQLIGLEPHTEDLLISSATKKNYELR